MRRWYIALVACVMAAVSASAVDEQWFGLMRQKAKKMTLGDTTLLWRYEMLADWGTNLNCFADSSANNYTGYATSSVAVPVWSNNTALFDGTSDCVTNTSRLGSRYTFSAWVKPSKTYRMSVIGAAVNSRDAVLLGTGTDLKGLFVIKSNAIQVTAVSSTMLTTNLWVMMAGVANGTNIEYYENGIRKASVATLVYTGNASVAVGATPMFWVPLSTNGYCAGFISDPRCYNRALASNEILQLYQSTSNTTPARP